MLLLKAFLITAELILSLLNPYRNLNYLKTFFRRNHLAAEGDFKTLLYVYSTIGIISLQAIKMFTLYLLPLSPPTRILLFDYFALEQMANEYNLATAFVLLMSAYYYYVGHFEVEDNTTMQLTARILFHDETRPFLSAFIGRRSVLQLLKKTALLVLNVQQAFVVILNLFVLNGQYKIYCVISAAPSYFLGSTISYLRLLLVQLNAFSLYIWIAAFIYLASMASTLSIVITEMIFIRFKQSQLLLHTLSHRPLLSLAHCHTAQLYRFFHHHTHNLTTALVFNRIYSKLLLAYIIANCPLNALIISQLLLQTSLLTIPTLFMGSLMIAQFGALFANHLMAAFYPLHIHAATGLLIRLNIEQPFEQHRAVKLKLTNYIAKLCTANRYGITFMSSGLVVTMTTFVKFILMFSQLFMISFILFRDRVIDY